MFQERIWLMLGLMMVSPILFVLILPDPYATVATLGANLAMLFYLRKFFKKIAGGLFGNKLKYECLTCHGTKFDKFGTCYRCGGKSRRVG